MKNKLNLSINASLRKFLLFLSFCIGINFLGCKQTHHRGEMSPEITLSVIAIEPAAPAVLGLGEKLVVIIHCETPSSEPVQVWTRPYKEGNLVRGYSSHHLVTVSNPKKNPDIVTGWFYFDNPKVIDEVRVFMRDLSSKDIIATHSYMIDVKWEGDSSPSPSNPPKRVASKPIPKRPPTDTTVYTIDIGDSPVLGAKEAVVTIVEFGDFQCPYSIREYPKIKQILQQYPDQVFFVFKHYPLNFHKKAPPAHAAAELARQEKGPDAFWQMHDLIMANPKKLEIADLRGYAQSLDLDLEKFDAVMADAEKINELLKADLAEAKKCKVRATPTVLINGLKMTNRTVEGYQTRIQQILKKEVAAGN
jgi:protein-disulfide isomerase